jgi:hypothetical protein
MVMQEGKRMLHAAGRYAELAALYKYHGKHDKVTRAVKALTYTHTDTHTQAHLKKYPPLEVVNAFEA